MRRRGTEICPETCAQLATLRIVADNLVCWQVLVSENAPCGVHVLPRQE
jgi:hypothetical protein